MIAPTGKNDSDTLICAASQDHIKALQASWGAKITGQIARNRDALKIDSAKKGQQVIELDQRIRGHVSREPFDDDFVKPVPPNAELLYSQIRQFDLTPIRRMVINHNTGFS